MLKYKRMSLHIILICLKGKKKNINIIYKIPVTINDAEREGETLQRGIVSGSVEKNMTLF